MATQDQIANRNQAINHNPHSFEAYYNRGLALFQMGDRQTGMRDLHKAVKLFSEQNNSEGRKQVMDAIDQLQRIQF